jgi:flagellar biosynthetic protein FlhB
MADKSEQTEKATPHKLKKAREDGKFPAAKDLVAAVQFAAFVAWLSYSGDGWMAQVKTALRILFTSAFGRDLSLQGIGMLLVQTVERCFLPLAPLAGILLGITLAMQLLVTGFGFSAKGLMPDLNRLNPLSKFKQLRRQNIPAFFQAMVLIPAFGYAVYVIVRDRVNDFYSLPAQSLGAAVHVVTSSLQDLLWKAAGAFMVFGLVNFFRQRQQWSGDMKMSKQEIKDESKQTDGNPQIKSRVRRLQRELRRRTMMKDVAKATAVIVNPTHFAVAIRYKMSSMAAPTVLAKGKNFLALRIRKMADEHEIPIIENPPLAQALYKSADVGQEIPAELYKAVAEVLAYIFKLMKGRMPGQEE